MNLISVTKIQGGSLIKVHGYTSLIAAPEIKESSQKKKGQQEVNFDFFGDVRKLYGGIEPIN